MTTVKTRLRLFKTRNLRRGFMYSWRLAAFQIVQFVQHSTPRKVVNYSATKIQKWLKRDKVWGMPYYYVIDPLNVCNLRCPLCPTGLGILGRERGKMSFDRFTQLVDQIHPYAYTIELYNWGEPFLHPQIFEIIQHAHARNIALRLSTNFNRFNRDMAARTVASGLDLMIVSVDGAKQETYEKYRRGGNLDKVIDNIRMLVEEKRKAKSRTPFIVFRMLATRYNEAEIDQLRRMADELGVDAFSVSPIHIDTTNQAQIDEWLPTMEELSFYNYSAEKLENVWACADLWERMTINWDGGVAPCCWLHEHKHDFADAFDRPLKEIWNGEAYISSRRVFAFGGPKEGPQQTICSVCKGRPLYLKD